ncbi:MAG: hypothetical protein MUO26_09575 [Methanotrichaceae archaeon]|nr:hypothetical protein [Methanotrichaceae archaeon]
MGKRAFMRDLFVGLESATDVWVKLRSLNDLIEISSRTKSGMHEELVMAYQMLLKNIGDEIPVDGKATNILIDEIKGVAQIETSIGGSAAIETSQFLALGACPCYLGNYYPRQIEGSPFSKADFSLADPLDLNPISIILQTSGDRFILANGEGRRIDYLLSYIVELPNLVAHSSCSKAFSLVGWHVLFGLGVNLKDVNAVVSSIQRIRKYGLPMFTDMGGFGKKSDQEIRWLWKIYELFDILSMNEREFQKLCDVFSLEGSEEQRLERLMELGRHPKTIWLHTRDYQLSISCQFSPLKLAIAQEFSSAAGCLRVETGDFPSIQEIKSRNAPNRSTNLGNAIRTKSLKIRSFKTEVGAGDVSAASFLWSLLN